MKRVCQRVHTAHYERVRLLRILATDLQSDCAQSRFAFVLRIRCVLQGVMFC